MSKMTRVSMIPAIAMFGGVPVILKNRIIIVSYTPAPPGVKMIIPAKPAAI